jgi:hypothetical protein
MINDKKKIKTLVARLQIEANTFQSLLRLYETDLLKVGDKEALSEEHLAAVAMFRAISAQVNWMKDLIATSEMFCDVFTDCPAFEDCDPTNPECMDEVLSFQPRCPKWGLLRIPRTGQLSDGMKSQKGASLKMFPRKPPGEPTGDWTIDFKFLNNIKKRIKCADIQEELIEIVLLETEIMLQESKIGSRESKNGKNKI